MRKRPVDKTAFWEGKPIREFKGTRDECHDWLLNSGFMFDRGNLVHPKLAAAVVYEHHGDFLGEVRDWDKPAFIAKVFKR